MLTDAIAQHPDTHSGVHLRRFLRFPHNGHPTLNLWRMKDVLDRHHNASLSAVADLLNTVPPGRPILELTRANGHTRTARPAAGRAHRSHDELAAILRQHRLSGLSLLAFNPRPPALGQFQEHRRGCMVGALHGGEWKDRGTRVPLMK